jgi:hypothetical protein
MSVPSLLNIWGVLSSITDGTASAWSIDSLSGGADGFFHCLPR